MSHRLLPRAALIGGLALAVLAATPVAASPPTVDRGEAAAGWLARQMVDGERFETVFDGVAYPDQGLTLDAVFAFAATGTADDHADRALDWLAEPGVTGGYVGEGTESYAGATAKLSLAVQVRGGDPSTFAGLDLEARLRALETATGRFSDASAWGDYSNAFSQSLAILTLDRTTTGAPSTAVGFLAGSRCADGGYPLLFGESTCTSSVDATAYAVQALLAVGRWPDAGAGLRWLASVQSPNGSFSDLGVENANSTGLAAQALLAGGRLGAAIKARQFVKTLQIDCTGTIATRGAINLKAGPFDPSTANRATAQAVLGLGTTSLADLDADGSATGDPLLYCH
ncbi:peptidase [Phytomonospora sp. NPDC050363]|uniref:peptidase n=1 Tax=Phytomonospora sp. NPDC050363 TaxID=3155642 RepID=UPI00340D0EE6